MIADPFPGWVVPEGYTADNLGPCRGCGALMLWCITPKGKRSPHDRDGVSHFSTCPMAAAFKRRR